MLHWGVNQFCTSWPATLIRKSDHPGLSSTGLLPIMSRQIQGDPASVSHHWNSRTDLSMCRWYAFELLSGQKSGMSVGSSHCPVVLSQTTIVPIISGGQIQRVCLHILFNKIVKYGLEDTTFWWAHTWLNDHTQRLYSWLHFNLKKDNKRNVTKYYPRSHAVKNLSMIWMMEVR